MLSVIVIARNEQDLIKGCLESIKWADEIIVLDNSSTDKTFETAKKYTDKVYKVEEENFDELRNKAAQKASGDWILYVDSDERVLASLKEEVKDLVSSGEYSAYAISRKNIIFGQEVNYGPYKHDWVIRLLKRDDFENWVGKVHEYPRFKGKLGYSKNSLLHLTHRNLDHFILKSLEWSKIDAKLRLNSGHPKMTKTRFIRILLTEFYEQLVKRKGLFGGTVGIIDSVLQVFSFYMTYIRLWEMQQKKPLDEVYKDIDKQLLENDFRL